MALKIANNVSTTLSAGITAAATTITVVSSTNMPTLGGGDYFYLTLQSADGANIEVVKVTARTGVTLTAVRAQDNTVGFAFLAGAFAEMRLCAALVNELNVTLLMGAANGVATLDGTSKLTGSQLPASIASTYATIASLASYLTTASASATYATIASLSSYLTTATAASTYATIASLSSYLTTASAASTYLTIATASSTYEPKSSFTANGRTLVGSANYAAMATLLTLGAASAVVHGSVTLGGGLLFSKLSISATDPVLANLIDGEIRFVY